MKDGKQWYQSKTVWAGMLIAAVGVLNAFGVNVPTDLVVSIASGLGIVGIRDALPKK